jgi:hypothetical protein
MAKKKSNKGGSRQGAGRPATHPDGAMVMLSARVPQSLVSQLGEHVNKTGATRSQIITDAIREVLKTQ